MRSASIAVRELLSDGARTTPQQGADRCRTGNARESAGLFMAPAYEKTSMFVNPSAGESDHEASPVT
jgi:hypothetical protein